MRQQLCLDTFPRIQNIIEIKDDPQKKMKLNFCPRDAPSQFSKQGFPLLMFEVEEKRFGSGISWVM